MPWPKLRTAGRQLNIGPFCVITYMRDTLVFGDVLGPHLRGRNQHPNWLKAVRFAGSLQACGLHAKSYRNRRSPSVRPKGRSVEPAAFLLPCEILLQREEELATGGRTRHPLAKASVDGEPIGEERAKSTVNTRQNQEKRLPWATQTGSPHVACDHGM